MAWDRAGMGEVTQGQVGTRRAQGSGWQGMEWALDGLRGSGRVQEQKQGRGQREGHVQAEAVAAPLWPRPLQPRSQPWPRVPAASYLPPASRTLWGQHEKADKVPLRKGCCFHQV